MDLVITEVHNISPGIIATDRMSLESWSADTRKMGTAALTRQVRVQMTLATLLSDPHAVSYYQQVYIGHGIRQ